MTGPPSAKSASNNGTFCFQLWQGPCRTRAPKPWAPAPAAPGVRAHISEVRSCYSAALNRDPNLSGAVAIEFEIGPTGKIGYASVYRNDTGDATLGTCIAKLVERWNFPKPPGGSSVKVIYPFKLSPG